MRILALTAFLLLAGCAGPGPNDPHPFDKMMTDSNTPDLSRMDQATPCSVYGCRNK